MDSLDGLDLRLTRYRKGIKKRDFLRTQVLPVARPTNISIRSSRNNTKYAMFRYYRLMQEL